MHRKYRLLVAYMVGSSFQSITFSFAILCTYDFLSGTKLSAVFYHSQMIIVSFHGKTTSSNRYYHYQRALLSHSLSLLLQRYLLGFVSSTIIRKASQKQQSSQIIYLLLSPQTNPDASLCLLATHPQARPLPLQHSNTPDIKVNLFR